MTYDEWLAEILRRADRRRTMANDLIMQLDFIGQLMHDIDSIRDRAKDLIGGPPDMQTAKNAVIVGAAASFDALVDYQRALLNGPYRNPKDHGRPIRGIVKDGEDA